MKTIGLIGGMSWESTREYYSLLNGEVNRALGKNHSASCLISSFDFQIIEDLQSAGAWDALETHILDAGRSLKQAGAQGLAICTNTMHKVADRVEDVVGVPLLHIVDAVGDEVGRHDETVVGLLGTRFTMEQTFYRDRLARRTGLDVVVPEPSEQDQIHRIIYEELVKGIVKEESLSVYLRILDAMVRRNRVSCVVLGCTEIGLLVKDYDRPLYDSTRIHAARIARFCLEQNGA